MTAIAVVAAMGWEARGLARSAVEVAVSGPGPGCAAHAARRLAAAGASGLVSWGVAAGLDPALEPGDLLLPRRVSTADGDIQRLDSDWHARVLTRCEAFRPVTGVLVESSALLCDAGAKATLRERSGAVACDMESAAVVGVALESGLPALVVRAVLDPASAAVPERWARVVSACGEIDPRALVGALLRPALWRSGLALARYRRSAARTLRAAAPSLAAG